MNEGETFIHLKYLLIIGDEDVIEPVFHYQGAPSDDYFSEKNWNGSINQFPTNPLLSTGRLLVNNNTEAINIIDNIKEYISEPMPLDIIEEFVNNQGWYINRLKDEEITAIYNGKWCDYSLHFAWLERTCAVSFTCAFDIRIPEEKVTLIHTLTYLNLS